MLCQRLVMSLICGIALTGCQNYTTQPVCNDDNAVVPPGLTGVYTLSVQNEDFTVTTQEIVVGVGAKGAMTMTAEGKTEPEESRLCEVGGHFVQEDFIAELSAYEQSRIHVTGMGLTLLPLFYDKAALDAAGIPSKVFEVPESVRSVLGETASTVIESLAAKAARFLDDDAVLGLMIETKGLRPRDVMQHSVAGPVGLTFLRK